MSFYFLLLKAFIIPRHVNKQHAVHYRVCVVALLTQSPSKRIYFYVCQLCYITRHTFHTLRNNTRYSYIYRNNTLLFERSEYGHVHIITTGKGVVDRKILRSVI